LRQNPTGVSLLRRPTFLFLPSESLTVLAPCIFLFQALRQTRTARASWVLETRLVSFPPLIHPACSRPPLSRPTLPVPQSRPAGTEPRSRESPAPNDCDWEAVDPGLVSVQVPPLRGERLRTDRGPLFTMTATSFLSNPRRSMQILLLTAIVIFVFALLHNFGGDAASKSAQWVSDKLPGLGGSAAGSVTPPPANSAPPPAAPAADLGRASLVEHMRLAEAAWSRAVDKRHKTIRDNYGSIEKMQL
jgi:hypothetical protein